MSNTMDWPQIRLGNVVVDMQAGFAQRPGQSNANVPQLRTNNVSPQGTIDLSELVYVSVSGSEFQKYRVQKGDVIFNNTNSTEWVGKTAYFDLEGDYVHSNHMTRLRADGELLDAEFLALYLHYLWRIGQSGQLSKQWVNQAAIDQETLSSFQIPFPPLPEQRRIAAILREADEIRKLRRRANEKAQEIVSALFYDMFGDPATNPKEWRLSSLSKVGFLDRGRSQHRPRDAAHLYGGPYPFIQTGDIANSDGWITSYTQTYSEAGLTQSRLWRKGTLCVTIAANIAKTAILTFDACFPDSIVGFTPRPDVVVVYVRQWFVSIQSELEKLAPQAAQKNINLEVLRNLQVPLPPLLLQNEFASLVAEIYENTTQQNKTFQHFDALHQSLLDRAFTGELSATWREQHVEELAQAARERDHLLTQLRLAPAELVTLAQPTRSEISDRQELLVILNDVQRALLAMLNEQLATYYTANSAHEELITIECSLDVVRRELHFLAAAGWIKEQTLPAEADPGSIRYIPVYRSLLLDDNSQQPDIDQLIARLGSEYPDEVLV